LRELDILRDVTDLGQAGQRDQLPDAVLGHQRVAASLVASDPAQRTLQLVDVALERVDHSQRNRDPLDGVRWQIDAGEELTAGRA